MTDLHISSNSPIASPFVEFFQDSVFMEDYAGADPRKAAHSLSLLLHLARVQQTRALLSAVNRLSDVTMEDMVRAKRAVLPGVYCVPGTACACIHAASSDTRMPGVEAETAPLCILSSVLKLSSSSAGHARASSVERTVAEVRER